MELYLLRHGFAEERSSTGRDSDRLLTPEGISGLESVLELARDAGVRPSLILSSPYARAKQTAEIAARILGYTGKVPDSPAFAPDSSPFRVWEEVRMHNGESSIIVAAHEPLLSSTMAWFAGSAREMVRFVPAAMVRIDFAAPGPHPNGLVRWMISPELCGPGFRPVRRLLSWPRRDTLKFPVPHPEPELSPGVEFERLVQIMARLRSPDGCPWDREQNFDTIKPYLLEEAYEVMDAIDARDFEGLAEELGDLLLQPVFFAQMASEEGRFNIADSLAAINDKLIRRHPHVFADGDAKTSGDVKRRWDEIKADENKVKKKPRPKGLLAGVSRSLPALVEAQQIASRAAGAGFDWENIEQVFDQLREELAELDEAREQAQPHRLEDEIGDLLFVIVNLARFLKVDPEQALRGTNAKFRRRFAHVELGVEASGKTLREATMEEMESLWQDAKRRLGMIEVRPLTSHAEYAEAVNLQRIIWKFDELELLPVRLFVTATKVGGQALGAFDGPKMVGFSLAIPGIGPGGKIYLHSHMVGVLAEYRDHGVGRMLKEAQRENALSRGMNTIEWTFDPLEIKNAYFNIERLGAIVRRFVLNQYGATTSPLHGGLPTDRCVAEWWIRTPRVQATLAGTPIGHEGVTARIEVPATIDSLKRTSPAEAREIQKRVSEGFLENFSKDLAVVGFERTPEAGIYLLRPWVS